jgi:prefoldin subunit 5|tara:strand:+ start:1150 stop:1329 length:180 start_codon:yes stop_codon:yes gene_type:complete
MIVAEWEIKKLDRRIQKLEAERQALEADWAKMLEEKADVDRLINEMLETLVNLTATHEL